MKKAISILLIFILFTLNGCINDISDISYNISVENKQVPEKIENESIKSENEVQQIPKIYVDKFPVSACQERIVNTDYVLCNCSKHEVSFSGICFPKEYFIQNNSIWMEKAQKLYNPNLTFGSCKHLEFNIYPGVNENYITKLRRSDKFDDKDHVLNNINQPIQDLLIEDIITAIKKLTDDTDEQARIAISLVQWIHYDYEAADNPFYYRQDERFAYEVLIDHEGLCGEKAQLLILLLKKLGYGTAYMVFEEENHATAAIKCPEDYSYKETGWCFIETTDTAYIGNSNNNYVDVGKLSYNPIIYVMSEGKTYEDIRNYIEHAKSLVEKGEWFELKDKSGAVVIRKSGGYYTAMDHGDIIIKYPD